MDGDDTRQEHLKFCLVKSETAQQCSQTNFTKLHFHLSIAILKLLEHAQQPVTSKIKTFSRV